MEKVLITGGAGFIGSHMVDLLIDDYDIVVLDDLSAGNIDNIKHHLKRKNFTFQQGSITSGEHLSNALDGVSTVFHFAAQPDVRLSVEKPIWDFEINVAGSLLLLDKIRQRGISKLVFSSSGGTVYGETQIFPTPESTAFRPISNYGAAKGAFEMYMSSYAELYGINSVSMRLANVIGPRLTHGVIYDFYMKLKRNSNQLEVLGDGLQEKAYIDINDTVKAARILAEKMEPGYTPVNVSSGDRLQVKRIAEIVVDALDVSNAEIIFTGGNRGWVGDVAMTDIGVDLLRSYNWEPEVSLEESVRQTVYWLVEKYGGL